MDTAAPTVAAFITPHGFGHATRALAVLAELHARRPVLRFAVFTRVPRWLVDEALPGVATYHEVLTDLGVAQTSALAEDLPETLRRLDAFLPFRADVVAALAAQVRACGARLVLCDIAPLGIAVAHAAGVRAALLENFTWDFIYEGYPLLAARGARHIAYLRETFAAADYHLQTEPISQVLPCDVTTPPIARRQRAPERVRERLGVGADERLVLISFGGVPQDLPCVARLRECREAVFVLTGPYPAMAREGNVIRLPYQSGLHHPDLLAAADAAVVKAGYSVVAELYYAGTPFFYVVREQFRESPPMAAYIRREMNGDEISAAEFARGDWVARLPALLARPRRPRPEGAGVVAAADFLLPRL